MADTGVQFQANFKLPDGTLLNVYADGFATFEQQLTNLQDASTLIKSVASSLGAAAQASNGSNAVAYAKQALNATVVATPAGDAPDCKHGTMSFRSGVGQKGPWKGWMCAAPKGAADKCETVWVR
jgi:hypothetical protein